MDIEQKGSLCQEAYNFNMQMLGTGAQIIRSLGIKKMRVHTSTEGQTYKFSGFGLEVCDVKIMEHSPFAELNGYFESHEVIRQ